MTDSDIRYYILFASYTHGMALHAQLRSSGIASRIAPAPRLGRGVLSCGMSLLIMPQDIEAARRCIEQNGAPYQDIVALDGPLMPHRDQYC